MFGAFEAWTRRSWISLTLLIGGLHGQTCLMLSRPLPAADGTAEFDVYLHSTERGTPAALQWSLVPASRVTSFAVDDGPILTGSGKTVACSVDVSGYKCLAVGPNMNTIGNGIIAKLTIALSPGGIRPALRITNPVAASADGWPVPIRVSADCRRPPLRRTLADK